MSARLAAVFVGTMGLALAASAQSPLEARVAAVLERRGLGVDALSVIDNFLRHGAPAPPAAPPLVRATLARPVAATDAPALFRQSVPASVRDLADVLSPPSSPAPFRELLDRYIDALARAQRELRSATRGFDKKALAAGLREGWASAGELLDVASAVDVPALERANRRFLEATLRFSRAVRGAPGFPAQAMRFDSPIGAVVIGTPASERHDATAALIIDPGGDDVYERVPVDGAAVSVIIDLAGNDSYGGSDVALRGLAAIVDFAGDDRYAMSGAGLAAAIAGASLLLDAAGNDAYEARHFAQGAAAYGIGALLDLAGDDRYRAHAWSQGFGLAHGLGLLWDRGGADHYSVQGVADAYNRGGGVSGAQGAARGFREQLAAGIGILRDDAGDDRYEAQMFAQGIGYYYGLGLLWDLGGDDRYEAVRYAQGSGVHRAVGVLADGSGDDSYALSLGYGQGMGHDLAVGVLLDGAGTDSYLAGVGAQGAATANGFGLLGDGGGADRFEIGPNEQAWGRAEWLRGLPSVGVLLHGASAVFARDGKPVAVSPDAVALGGPFGGSPVATRRPAPLVCPAASDAPPARGMALDEALRRIAPAFYGEPLDAAAYAEVRRRLRGGIRSSLAELAGKGFSAAWSFGEALRCLLRDATPQEAAGIWRELEPLALEAPPSRVAVAIGTALRARPPAAPKASRIASALHRHPDCSVRALALWTWPDADRARSALGSSCWRLQAAARGVLMRLGYQAGEESALPSFLRQTPPQEDAF